MASAMRFDAIGTTWTIDLRQKLTPERVAKLERTIRDRIDQFDRDYSRFRVDSLVTRMSKAAGTYDLPIDAEPMLALYRRLYELTGRRVTPLVGRLMEEAGYDSGYSLIARELHAPPAWDDAMSYDPPRLTLRQPALLDFGAAGKGHIVDIVGALLCAAGVSDFTIDAGGDILHHGAPTEPLRVGLEHPLDPTQAVGLVELTAGSICASATNRRRWGDLHHIINPLSLRPVTDVIATWAIADTALLADGLATALFFVPPSALEREFDFQYAIVSNDQSVRWSKDLPGEVFSS
jgi:thiamine biosynthesis lipoprotein